MKKLFFILALLSPGLALTQTPPPAPASASDVLDGTATYKFVSPKALRDAGVSSPTNGLDVVASSNLSYRISATNNTTGNAATATVADYVKGVLTNAFNAPTGYMTTLAVGGIEGTLTNNTSGNAATATVAASATNWGTAEILLNPPHIGPTKTSGNYATIQQNSHFCYVPGSGIIRSLWYVPVIGLQWTNVPNPNLTLRIYPDIGSNTNPPSSSYRAVSIPINELMMFRYRFASNGNYQLSFDSKFLTVYDASTNSTMQHAVRTFVLKMPMYYTNGILFELTNTAAANTLWSNGYFQVTYEPGTLPAPYESSHRLRNVRYNAAISDSVSNYLGSASGSGLIIGLMQSALGLEGDTATGLTSYLDSHAIRIDHDSTFWESTGGDDLFGGTYAMVRGPFAEHQWGTPHWLGDTTQLPLVVPLATESYRWLEPDHIAFTNGFHLSVTPNGDLISSGINCFYYAQ